MCGGFWFLLQSLQLQELYSKRPNTGGTACSPQTKDRNSSLTLVTPGGRLPWERWKAFPGTSTGPTDPFRFSWLYEEQFLNVESWSLFNAAVGWTSGQGIPQYLLRSLQPHACGGRPRRSHLPITVRADGEKALSQAWQRLLRNYPKFGICSSPPVRNCHGDSQ